MSADNTIVVLGTVAERKCKGGVIYKVPKSKVYRVAHVQAWDNFEWYKENQPYNLGHYLWEVFTDDVVYYEKSNALAAAHYLYACTGYVEYGIQVVDTEYVFPGD